MANKNKALSQINVHTLSVREQDQVLEYSRQILTKRFVLKDVSLTRGSDANQYVNDYMQGFENEVFCCLFLDSQHKVIEMVEMFQGTINQAPVFPREIAKAALSRNAAAVILAHNHPSGVAEPSRADKEITECIQEALQLIDVRVLDHFIVGDQFKAYSFAEYGLI
ncbi:MAG: DNA repair protein RadC [Alphaproteobacteria bacterium]|nr:DNA repair protein RadC [Alphaproteobacteria bacterium]